MNSFESYMVIAGAALAVGVIFLIISEIDKRKKKVGR
jgi:hypothetical protein